MLSPPFSCSYGLTTPQNNAEIGYNGCYTNSDSDSDSSDEPDPRNNTGYLNPEACRAPIKPHQNNKRLREVLHRKFKITSLNKQLAALREENKQQRRALLEENKQQCAALLEENKQLRILLRAHCVAPEPKYIAEVDSAKDDSALRILARETLQLTKEADAWKVYLGSK